MRNALTVEADSPLSATRGHPLGRAKLMAAWLLAGSAVLGLGLAILWSPSFVDQTIGENGASTILGYSVTATPLTGAAMAIVFAFVSGLTGTFTACNIAGFSAIGPLSGDGRSSVSAGVRSHGWVAAGAVAVAGAYGSVAALIGPSIPQLSTALVGRIPVRLVQSMVVFGVLGLALVVAGLAAAGLFRLSLARLLTRRPAVRLLLVGAMIGAFLIGRPFALFMKIFQYAVSTHNPVLGAFTFVLQSVGNIVVMALLFLAISAIAGGRIRRWLATSPERAARFNAVILVTAGTFLVAYWCVRLPAFFGIGWWPKVPWS